MQDSPHNMSLSEITLFSQLCPPASWCHDEVTQVGNQTSTLALCSSAHNTWLLKTEVTSLTAGKPSLPSLLLLFLHLVLPSGPFHPSWASPCVATSLPSSCPPHHTPSLYPGTAPRSPLHTESNDAPQHGSQGSTQPSFKSCHLPLRPQAAVTQGYTQLSQHATHLQISYFCSHLSLCLSCYPLPGETLLNAKFRMWWCHLPSKSSSSATMRNSFIHSLIQEISPESLGNQLATVSYSLLT